MKIAPATLALVDLFEGPLRDVRFPDAGAERLGLALDAVAIAEGAVAHAEAALEAARAVLAEKERTVTQETERTLAYARIYAQDHPALQSALDALTETTPRRRRRRKTAAAITDVAAE